MSLPYQDSDVLQGVLTRVQILTISHPPKTISDTIFFYALDEASGELANRFEQRLMLVPKEVESLLLTAANSSSTVTSGPLIPQVIQSMYAKDIDMRKLQTHLSMLPDLVKSYQKLQKLSVLNITKVSTIADMFAAIPTAKDLLSEVDKLLRLYLTIPITTCTAERSFSALRRVKTYLRSSMPEERLNNVLLLNVHKEEADSLDLINIAYNFVSANARRCDYFGKFE